MEMIKWVKPLPYLVTIVTSVLLFAKYLISIESQGIAMHLHAWFGLLFLVMITQKLGNNFKKK